ncbi:2-hydroxyacid dehydrogenase [Rubripirellula reticaptiva]|uniref:Putative 2-hydroxyacid dehydrogenase n=1 Tax=Rubripirellula reticaptiva TaxID=2528013 RepID=A0A5C6EI79_9BACT|nr:D-glycerate dehydrogenase [Rubripirellula reticaptiva]TWU47767.1 putative 2-hydroxyacid dehydrogenase [Rubripirellula reticaptiva]
MTRPKIFLTRELPPESMAILRQQSDLTFNPDDRVLTKAEIIAGVQDVDGLLCLLTDLIDDEILAANSNLKVVANFAVGFNNIDVDAATDRKILVTNTPGVLTDTTADMAFALLLSAARRVVEGDQFVRAGNWHGWGPLQFLGNDVSGSTLGLIGFGRIAQAVARRARGFDMKIVYWNRTRLSPEQESSLGVVYAEMDEVLRQSDYVSVHVALNDETKHLIGARELSLMKPIATIVNTARGPIIDEAALVAALQDGTIASAGLDVYEREPELHPDLYQMPNAVIAPHLGSATIGTRTKMGNMAAENCLAACRGEVPPNLVNPESIG